MESQTGTETEQVFVLSPTTDWLGVVSFFGDISITPVLLRRGRPKTTCFACQITMRTYDFRSLNDKDFEMLACDLLSREHGTRFERFKQGKDGGIDGRYFSSPGESVILQCKHWARSGVNALINSLKSTELAKVKKLSPSRYLLATSLALSPANKESIKEVMSPFITSEADIFGAEDINDLLAKHGDIERNHYKLWLSGTNVLEAILHNAILGRSSFVAHEILSKSSKYVETEIHVRAARKLEEQNVVIVTGEPGVGKTTLAEQLCLEYVRNEFQLVVIADEINEAEAVFSAEKPQIFYFDDFLGRNYLSALSRHEDTHIVNFIKRVTKDRTKRFVLTSRTNVLNQGKRLSDAFGISKLDKNELEVRVTALRETEKAKLLYNHIWFSDLTIEYVEQILEGRRYREIITHQNFNPRLVSFVTDARRLEEIPPEKYWEYIREKLDNPADIWAHTYESQLDSFSRLIVLIVVLNGGEIYESDLLDAYYRALKHPIAAAYTGVEDFHMNIRTLTGSLLNRNKLKDVISIKLFNPSVADYVVNRIRGDAYLIESIFSLISSEKAISNLEALAQETAWGRAEIQKHFSRLAKQQLNDLSDYLSARYKLVLASAALALADSDEDLLKATSLFIKSFPNDAASQPGNWAKLGDVIAELLSNNVINEEDAWRLLSCINLADCGQDVFEVLGSITHLLSKKRSDEFTLALKDAILTYWEDMVYREIQEQDVLSDYFNEDDKFAAEQIILSTVRDLLDQSSLTFGEADIERIAANCNVMDIISDNIVRASKGYESSVYQTHMGSSDDAIDDLFTVDFPSSAAS